MEEVEALVPDGDGVDGGARVDGEEADDNRCEAELEVVPEVVEVRVREGVVREVQDFGEEWDFAA